MQTKIVNFPKSAFTLIELLVVIAIIAILAAILFPVFGRARENARRSSCLSNLKQMGLGVMQYTQDYDENYPLWNNNDSSGWNKHSWDYQIQPYVKSTQIFVCPSDSTTVSVDPKRSYSANCGDSNTTTDDDRPLNYQNKSISIAKLVDSSGTILITERPNAANKLGSESWSEVKSPSGTNPQLNSPLTTPSHFDGWAYMFCDGHAKWLLPARTVGTGTVSAPKGMWTMTEND